MADLDQLRHPDNLNRAWRWIRSNPDATYKSYFRPLYQHFAVAEAALLQDLGERLKRDIYEPEPSCKIFQPKPSGILRPISLLSVEDQITYQAAVNLIAEKLYPRVVRRYSQQVFGHLYAGKTSLWFYRKWSDGYKAFRFAPSWWTRAMLMGAATLCTTYAGKPMQAHSLMHTIAQESHVFRGRLGGLAVDCDALAANESAVQAMGNDKLKVIAAELITQ